MNLRTINAEQQLNIIRLSSLFLFTVIVIILSWHCDDAYHSYVMAKNFVEGNGFVYNIGERVNASTCPLFTDASISANWIISLFKSFGVAVLGLLPFIFWELSSVFYYGFFVPNTAFAKLNDGLPLTDYLIRGVAYFISSGIFDILVLVVPLLYSGVVIWRRDIKHLLIVAGILLYFAYVLYIG